VKFKFKKLAMILAMTTAVGSVTACSKKEKEEKPNNVVQQEAQIENETEVDKDTDVHKDTQVDKDTQIDSENQIDNTKDEEESNTETIDKTISEEKALDICKERLAEIWNVDFLSVGSDESGSDKIVNINDKTYYAIYYIDDENDIMADFRFLVDESSGELFYQSPEDLNKLVPIDEYLSESKNNDSLLLNNNSNE